MSPLGVNKTVLLGVLTRSPQLHYGREGNVRALLSLTTRVLPVGVQCGIPGASLEDAHLVYFEGGLAARLADLAGGALVYLEGRNREQRMTDPSGKSHRLAYVAASIVRYVNSAPAREGANSVTLVGTVTRDPIHKTATDGQPESVRLHLMTTHRQHDEATNTPRYSGEHHWVTFYGRVAEFVAARAQEGNLIYIEGRNQPRRWRDAEGLNHRTITVVGHYFQLLQAESKLKALAPEFIETITHGYDVQLPVEEVALTM